mmetsp:Transcript_22506/g.33565  ORF Transcript_22506/g.33565 Transcript_22506/m.33565 type:complete len:458 (+) Transcript_22506:265-1638(+)|eukprot:CAMPEP_0167742164 /NCGR_PEP_ID=MMETSP0110_2-20121227/1272_1 /TAXON_ID=629695 /ORGANISM="Gymnochlora sp., Strain CCMP2014" /LENGTH=457 /DNA_ID=CAMNT_0007626321 /DNA_START=935 /DNA_END=2308 /DNA_ORIENTATION=+
MAVAEVSILEPEEDDVKEAFIAKETRNDEGYWTGTTKIMTTNWVPLLANTFEWFEFSTFAYLVDPISDNFAQGNHATVWVIFSIAFLCRPLGGAIIGWLGDKMGRSPAFYVASCLVVFSTVLQGALPTYQTSNKLGGDFGLALLLILRVTQGIGIGGELGSGIIYLSESCPRKYVGMTMAWLSVTCSVGFLVSSFIAAVMHSTLSENEMLMWGWRVPFLLSSIPGAFILYLMWNMKETHTFEEVSEREENKKLSPLRVSILFVCMAGAAAFWYVGGVYIFDWLRDNQKSAGIGKNHVLWLAVSSNVIAVPTTILSGWMLDHLGGIKLLFPLAMGSSLILGVTFWLLIEYSPSLVLLILGPGILFGIPMGLLGSVTNLLSTDLFDPSVRHRSVGLAYNSAIMLFGGLGPAWVELCKNKIPSAGGFYIGLTTGMSLLAFWAVGESLLPKISKKKAGDLE